MLQKYDQPKNYGKNKKFRKIAPVTEGNSTEMIKI
jgi:hypothetical protein